MKPCKPQFKRNTDCKKNNKQTQQHHRKQIKQLTSSVAFFFYNIVKLITTIENISCTMNNSSADRNGHKLLS